MVVAKCAEIKIMAFRMPAMRRILRFCDYHYVGMSSCRFDSLMLRRLGGLPYRRAHGAFEARQAEAII